MVENQKGKRKNKIDLLKIILLVAVIIGLVIIIYPHYPRLKYTLAKPKDFYPYKTRLKPDTGTGGLPEVSQKKDIPKENRLVIPKIGVDVLIVEGTNEWKALSQGAWHIPGTSNPAQGGNTVISGHRFRFKPPNNTTFYLLDKLEKGDQFIIYWNREEYDYKVTEIKVVEPADVYILENTDDPRVTLYTCTPLFTTRQRLVVIGSLMAN